MNVRDFYTLKMTPEIGRRNEAVRNEVIEMHLSDTNAVVAEALCGVASSYDLRDLKGYLVDLLQGAPVGAICQMCKALGMPLAEEILEDIAQNLEDEGRLGDAEDCRGLADRLARETGLDRRKG